MDMIYKGLEYGIDFRKNGKLIKEVSFGLDQEGKVARDAAYAALEADPDSELKEVRLKLGQHAQDQAYEPNSYAYVGGLGHVKALLKEIDDFLS